MQRFTYTDYAREVIFGPGAVARLGEAAGRHGWRRLLLCTTGSQRRGGQVAAVAAALGDRLVAVYDRTRAHVPAEQVAAALDLAAGQGVDAIVGLGGGSAIGLAKAVGLALEERRAGRPARAESPADQPLVPVVAIPTTYAGSEMTPTYGVTRPGEGGGPPRKVTVTDPKVTPTLVVYDPELTLALPPDLTGTTAVNALAHCFEALYSTARNPLSPAAALGGLRAIAGALPRAHAAGDDLAARAELLAGAHLAGAALASVAMGLHHGLCHVLGGSAGVPHGVANTIVLPHALRFNLDATAARLAPAAGALGVAPAGPNEVAAAAAAVDWTAALIARLGLPRRLRDYGVPEADLPRLARLAAESGTVRANPKPATAADVEAILRSAW